jgi:hypothetical protein
MNHESIEVGKIYTDSNGVKFLAKRLCDDMSLRPYAPERQICVQIVLAMIAEIEKEMAIKKHEALDFSRHSRERLELEAEAGALNKSVLIIERFLEETA